MNRPVITPFETTNKLAKYLRYRHYIYLPFYCLYYWCYGISPWSVLWKRERTITKINMGIVDQEVEVFINTYTFIAQQLALVKNDANTNK